MTVRFLSQEWAQAVTDALNRSPEFSDAASGQQARIQQVVTDAPGGETKYFFMLEGGSAQLGLGDLENSEATITQSYDTAVQISKRDLHPQQAFIQGKLRIGGNLMKLMQLQGVLNALGNAVDDLDVTYPPAP